MKDRIREGEKNETVTRVRESDTARIHGSGLLDVYSTPAMVALMEKTSMELVQPYLDEGTGTVGTSLQIRHLKAVPVGQEIRCESILKHREGSHLTFEVRVMWGNDIIGDGNHKRFIIDERRFLSKLAK